MEIKLGNIKLNSRIFLAPMHQVNDIAFRVLCKKAGAGLTYTGLLNPLSKEPFSLNDKPALQFACNSTKGIKEFIKKYDKKISLYDFNLGCPSPHAKSSKIGYFMTNNTQAIEEILKTIKENTKKPLTIKIRKMPLENTKQIIKIAEKYCQAIAVHPRTQPQGYSGEPDLEFARQVKKLTRLPIIYSGNIKTKQEAEKMLKEFDFIMIGRASFGNPNIFSEILEKRVKKFKFKNWLKLIKKLAPKTSFKQIKFQAINFTRSFEGSGQVRHKLSLARTEKELQTILKTS
jgi:tRNA-dihydrouridine synthase